MTVRRWLDATDKSYFLRINISIFEKQIFKWDPLSEKHDSKKLWCYTFWPNCKGLHDFGPYSWGAIFLDGTNILHYFWRNIYISRAKHIDLRKVYVYVCLCLAINISYLWPHGLFIYIAILWCKFFLLLINAFSTKGVIKQLQPVWIPLLSDRKMAMNSGQASKAVISIPVNVSRAAMKHRERARLKRSLRFFAFVFACLMSIEVWSHVS